VHSVGLEQVAQEGEQGSQVKVALLQYLDPIQVAQKVEFPIVEQVWQLGIMVVHKVHPPVNGLKYSLFKLSQPQWLGVTST
jgi:hypothetical protein